MALPNDMTRIVGEASRLAASSSEYSGDPKLAARTLIRRTIPFECAAVFANGTNNIVPNAAPAQSLPCDCRLIGSRYLPRGTATAAGANNAQIAVKTLHANGVVNATIASQTTNTTANGGTGNLVAGVAVALTPTDLANTRIPAGTVFGPAITQVGSGVAMPAGTMLVDVELEGADEIYPLSPG